LPRKATLCASAHIFSRSMVAARRSGEKEAGRRGPDADEPPAFQHREANRDRYLSVVTEKPEVGGLPVIDPIRAPVIDHGRIVPNPVRVCHLKKDVPRPRIVCVSFRAPPASTGRVLRPASGTVPARRIMGAAAHSRRYDSALCSPRNRAAPAAHASTSDIGNQPSYSPTRAADRHPRINHRRLLENAPALSALNQVLNLGLSPPVLRGMYPPAVGYVRSDRPVTDNLGEVVV